MLPPIVAEDLGRSSFLEAAGLFYTLFILSKWCKICSSASIISFSYSGALPWGSLSSAEHNEMISLILDLILSDLLLGAFLEGVGKTEDP